ncbi:glycine betaine/L-proline ABC transporter ATP-binding protein [Ornithinimicrobium ciconiae]|uniref:Glycine betaine/L-proline ABC transporter ATP-binding protein n=1 Tax=Ornithinimicrobium ciconiae TaxID=2594265 RepID=A0A516G747_9MICO|nr:glycine betaine/L-proline ABC transporter ATP-binding protein [Ornithinimicrobium ciconiae]QDO87351.1 glycine betaine/L-proline ABC transporter ATP-binding protein [Ornithinimicrobium ciconiae]
MSRPEELITVSVIRAEHAYKVFGRRPERAVERLRAGADREELHREGVTAAVIDASFEVNAGEIFVVMGLSGSGKSTLIRMVNGLLTPTAGQVEVAGHNVKDLDDKGLRTLRREKISMVFQHFALLPHRTVGENAAYGLTLQGINRADRQAQAERALEMVGLGGWGGSLPGELSGGMRQRVGLARALAAGTDVLLMDEAFSALDPLIRREMQDQLIELQQRLDKTILFITHDLNEAMRLGDRIAMMRDGRIVQIGTAEQILNDPANDYVAQFVQDVDRTRVLTASSVMEPPVAVLGSEQGPRTAHRLMREHQLSHLMVVDRRYSLLGVVREDDVARAVELQQDDLTGLVEPVVTVAPDVALADLFAASAVSPDALAVMDGTRLVGVIPRVTMLSALASVGGQDVAEADIHAVGGSQAFAEAGAAGGEL